MILSIIIPVYHVESTLNRCVESVLRQGLDDFEVILIDDGGEDKCPELCDEWARKDDHVRVVHQANGGLSAARNAGIEMAQGDYLTFVDSDDYVDDDLYARLMWMMRSEDYIDLLEFSVVEREGGGEERRLSLPQKRYTDMETYWLEGHAYNHTYAWNKIYRSKLFDRVRFPVGRLFEDVHTLPSLLAAARVVVTTPTGFYHYTDNPEGITRKATGRELQDLLDVQLDVCELTGREPQLPRRCYFSSPKLLLLQLLGMKRLCQLNQFIHKLMGRNRS